MSAPTLDAAVRALRARLEPVPTTSDAGPHDARRRWLEVLADLPTAPRGTMRDWMTAHNGADVDTYQWCVNSVGEPSSAWAPGVRRIYSSRASSVELDSSSRYYAGCTVLATSDDVLVIRSTYGDDMWQVAIYRVAS